MSAQEPKASTEGKQPDILEALSKISLFSGLTRVHLKRLADIGLRETYRKNELIFSEGDLGHCFYLILEGAVRISRTLPGLGEEALAVLRKGNYFGEMSLIDEEPRSADARCHEPCKVFMIKKSDLEDLLFMDRDLAYEILWCFVRTLSQRLRETNDKMTFLTFAGKFG